MYRPVALVLLGALALPLTAAAAVQATSPAPLDEHYLMSSIQGDRFEIAGGKIAMANGNCPAVTRLATRLVKDHSKSLAEDTTLAHRLSVKVPKSPTPSQQWELAQVGNMTGAAFDKAYSTLEARDHVEDIQNTTEEISKGQTASVQASARKELPVLRAHLALSQTAVKACSST
jgi:putative membrane protein